MRSLPMLVLGAFLPAAPVAAQAPPVPLPPELCAALDIRAGTAQDLRVPAAMGAFDVAVHVAGADRVLRLVPHDVRSPDFALLLDEPTGLRRLPTPPSVTMRGEVVGPGGGDVAASLIDGQLWATILLADGAQWSVQPLSPVHAAIPASMHAVYADTDVITDHFRCGVTELAPPAGGGGSTGPTALRRAELAVDADLAYYQRYGSSATSVQNKVTTTINSLNTVYRRDVEIEHSITTILIRTTNVYSWTGDLCNLLGQFRTRWRNFHTGVRRDMAHLFTGEGDFGGVVGCAYVGVVCGTSAYGASKVYSNNLATDLGLVAHEMGHNWSAGHCDSSPPCNIMCSGLGGCAGNLGAFGPTSIASILNHKNSRTCLDDPTPPFAPVLSSLAPSSVPIYLGGEITATGQYLDTVTGLTVAGVPTFYTLVDPARMRFYLPLGVGIGSHPVVATNLRGPSNALQIGVTGNHPSVVGISPLIQRGFGARIELHSDRAWVGDILLSTSNAPSAIPGIVALGIGGGFTNLVELGLVVCGASAAATITFQVPSDLPPGLDLHWQAVTFNPLSVTFPLEVSNVATSRVQ